MDPPLFKDGSQVASRPLQARFWRGFGTILGPFSLVFLANVWCFLHAFFSSMLQKETFEITRISSQQCNRELPRNSFSLRATSTWQIQTFQIKRSHQRNAAESFQDTAFLFVTSCIEKFTSERKVAFRSLLVQVETRQMSTIETGLALSQYYTSVLSQQQSSVLSQQQTSVLSQQQTSVLSPQKTSILSPLLMDLLLRNDRCLLLRQDTCLLLRQDRCLLLNVLPVDICLVSTADICPASTEDIYPVST